MEFIINNIGTIIVALVIFGISAMIIIKIIKDKKRGKTSCGCSCGCCPNSGLCHGHTDGGKGAV